MVNNYCLVKTCKSYYKDCRFVRVPCTKDTELRERWRILLGIDQLPAAGAVCCLHFLDTDFIDVRSDKFVNKKRLKKGVVPTLNLPVPNESVTRSTAISAPPIKVECVVEGKEGGADHDYTTGEIIAEGNIEPAKKVAKGKAKGSKGTKSYKNVTGSILCLQDRVASLQTVNESLKRKQEKLQMDTRAYQRRNKILEGRITALKKQDENSAERFAQKKEFVDKILEEKLKSHFTPAQIHYLLSGSNKRFRDISEEDCKRATILRLISPRAYRYLRNNKYMPLPSHNALMNASKKYGVPQDLSLLTHEIVNKDDIVEVNTAEEHDIVMEELDLKPDMPHHMVTTITVDQDGVQFHQELPPQ